MPSRYGPQQMHGYLIDIYNWLVSAIATIAHFFSRFAIVLRPRHLMLSFRAKRRISDLFWTKSSNTDNQRCFALLNVTVLCKEGDFTD